MVDYLVAGHLISEDAFLPVANLPSIDESNHWNTQVRCREYQAVVIRPADILWPHSRLSELVAITRDQIARRFHH